jgi:hypothetical protein
MLILVYAGFTWLRGQLPRRESVSSNPRLRAFKTRSRVQNPVNVGSRHQEAEPEPVNVHSVQPQAAQIAANVPPGDSFTLSPREMVQLGEALNLYREGATVEQAVCRAFGVTKGGSEGWKRSKGLFDAATVAPGAAPANTYTAAAAPKRRRRAAAATR